MQSVIGNSALLEQHNSTLYSTGKYSWQKYRSLIIDNLHTQTYDLCYNLQNAERVISTNRSPRGTINLQ